MLRAIAVFSLLAAAAAPARGGEPLLANGAFEAWADGLPERWSAAVGARRDAPGATSRAERLAEGGLALTGDAETTTWLLLQQRVAARPGAHLRLSFRARALDLRRDAGQFGSCYVGLLFRNADGGIVSLDVCDVRQAAWQEDTLHARVPPGASRTDVGVFLSQGGRLEVRWVALAEMGAGDAWRVLVEDVDRRYPFFEAHGVDWQALVAGHEAAGRGAKDATAFVAAVTPLLAALRDPHVWFETAPGERRPAWPGTVPAAFDLPALLARLPTHRQVIRNVLAGRTAEGYGCLVLGTMEGTPADLDAVDAAWRSLFDAPGLVLDLRVNMGGDERWGQRLMGCLAREPTLYGRQAQRSGPAHGDLVETGSRSVLPREDGCAYRGPVVALIGPACVSSGEGMALMAKALPDVVVVGLPTRGASGSPQPVHLPNGISVWYSRWISLQPDGTRFERTGIAPDVHVEHVPGADAALDEARALLGRRLSPPNADGHRPSR